LINLKNIEGHSAVMAAVYHQGQVNGLKRLSDEVVDVDWSTKNNDGKSLLEMAKDMNRKVITNFLEKRLRRRSRQETSGDEGEPATQRVKLDRVIPECPACLEIMSAPKRIFGCRNGHLVCSLCRPRLRNCTVCSENYSGRETTMEKLVRKLMNSE